MARDKHTLVTCVERAEPCPDSARLSRSRPVPPEMTRTRARNSRMSVKIAPLAVALLVGGGIFAVDRVTEPTYVESTPKERDVPIRVTRSRSLGAECPWIQFGA